jgi:3-ketosteroid 9alpha-monooxygenase subunit A
LQKEMNQVQLGTRVFPSGIIPSGWYQIGWSEDFQEGSSIPLQYFGKALVAFRGQSNSVRVLGAYCPHLGAHLGHGGRVTGDDIICPYHGWQWSGEDGKNRFIPYGDKERMNLSIPCWQTREIDGLVLVWFSPSGKSPSFEPPARLYPGEGKHWDPYPNATNLWQDVSLVPQFAAENVPDAAHFQYIHRSAKTPTLASFEAEGGLFTTNWLITFGEDQPPTWATPAGPLQGRITTRAIGVGIGWNTQYAFDDVTSFVSYTPIDEYRVDVRLTVWTPDRRSDGSPLDEELRDRWFRFQQGQLEADMQVWANQTYVKRPPYANIESSAMRALREWSLQFYEGVAGNGANDDSQDSGSIESTRVFRSHEPRGASARVK